MQTRIQQDIISNLLECLGVKYTRKYIKRGFQDIQGQINIYQDDIKELKNLINSPNTRKALIKTELKELFTYKKRLHNFESIVK